MTRRVVSIREAERERAMLMGLADECKRLSAVIQAGQCVTVDIHGKKHWVLGAAPCDGGRRPAIAVHEVNAANIIAPSSGFTIKGEIDETWGAILKSAGVERAPVFAEILRIIVPGQ